MTGATENQPRFVTMQTKLAENRERLERIAMQDKSEPAFHGIQGNDGHGNCTNRDTVDGRNITTWHNQGMTLRQYYFGQVAPAWVLAMAMRFHHEGYDDESAMAEAVRKAHQTADMMAAIQETKSA